MPRSVYFLGIGGTLLGNLAILAKSRGFAVGGMDDAIYPPMSDQLRNAGIRADEGFDPACLHPTPDVVVVGNARMARGTPAVEFVLDQELNYSSGAEWLGNEILRGRHVIAVSGTHGKTSTTAMVVWILEQAGLKPGFLVGGVIKGSYASARLGSGDCFVVEADEYDTSYFDRRSKFLHYRPKTLIFNNLEYDHADIFPSLESIKDQFHHLLRALPSSGLLIAPEADPQVNEVIQRGLWSSLERIGICGAERKPNAEPPAWTASGVVPDGSRFQVHHLGVPVASIEWTLLGRHNVCNALAAISAAHHVGVDPAEACRALSRFPGVKRRLDVIAKTANLTVYDDFAHHPTAIRTTLNGLRQRVGADRIVAVIEPRTHTMSLGTLKDDLRQCSREADKTIWFRSESISWDIGALATESAGQSECLEDIDRLVDLICALPRDPTHVVIMSNGGFQGIYNRVVERLAQ